jgi:hypothetical protein
MGLWQLRATRAPLNGGGTPYEESRLYIAGAAAVVGGNARGRDRITRRRFARSVDSQNRRGAGAPPRSNFIDSIRLEVSTGG